VAFLPGSGASLMTYGIYIDNAVVVTSVRETERESTHFLIKREIVLNDIVTVNATQTVSVKVKNVIGISKFYNRIITMRRIG
jgi:predicted GTPase